MSEDFWKSCKLQYLVLITFLVLAGLAGGLVVCLPCRAEIPSLGEKSVSMDFKDVDLKDAIGTLSVMTGWNIVVDKDVEGKVNVRFQDVPALQILGEILEINECQYEIEDNIIKVSRVPILNQSLLLEYALVSSVAPYLEALLSSEGSFHLDEATNTIVLSDKKKNLEKIAAFLQQMDIPAKQLQSKNFAIEFIPVDSVVFLLEDYLSAEGKIEVDPLANTLLLTETNRNFAQLEELLLNIDIYRAIEQIFTLKYALASSVAPLLENYLGPEDKLQVNEQANEIILSSDLYTLKKIGALLDSLDTPAKQLQSKSFTVKYLYLEELASIVEENLSSLGEIIERNQARSMFVVKDTSYNLSKIEKLIKQADVFIPLKKTYEIKFAPLAFLAEQVDGFLSDKGTLEIKEETFRFTVIDVKKNLDRIDTLVKKEDILQRQLISPVQFEEESLRDVLNLLSDEVRINMFISPEVEGEVTLRLGKPVPFLEALEAVLMQNYCQYEIKDNIITISKIPVFSQSFSLEYALAPSITSSVNALLSSEGSFQLDEATNTVIVSDKEEKVEEIAAFIAGLDTPAKQLQSKSFTMKFVIADEVASLLEDYLSAEGRIKIDPLANALFLTETSRNFAQLEKLILDSDVYQPREEMFTLEYALAPTLTSSIDALLSSEGSYQLDEATNTIIVSDKQKNSEEIAAFIAEIDTPIKQLQSKSFSIKFVSADSVASLLEGYLSVEGKIEVDLSTNTLLLTETKRNFAQLERLLSSLDIPDRQISEKSFSAKYLYLGELANLVEEELSPLGEKREDKDKAIVVVKDSRYNLAKIEKLIEERDVFLPLKKTYEIKFAPLSSLAKEIEDLLSQEGKILETREDSDTEDSGTIVVEDVKKNLDRVYQLVSREDTLEAQLIRRKRYVLKYLTPYEAKYYLEVNNLVSEQGEIGVPVVREKVEAGNVKAQSEYIIIPQEIVEDAEGAKVESAQVDLPEEEENVIYITDLKRNIRKIDEAIEGMNSSSRAEEIITKTFYIQEGSLERIALAMANILGINPGDIEGLEPKGEWMQMEVPTLEINLGTVGPR